METRSLACALTDAEVATRAAAMAKSVADLQLAEVEKKRAAEQAKEAIDHISGDIRRLAQMVRDRAELRDVEIDYRHDDIRYLVETIRTDTGEVIASRPMTQDEVVAVKQGELPFVGRGRRQKTQAGE